MESIYINLSAKHRRKRGRLKRIKPFARMLTAFLAAGAAASTIIYAIHIAAARLGPAGGELAFPIYIVIFIYFGWRLKEWSIELSYEPKHTPRKEENTPCTSRNHTAASARTADAASTPGRFASASAGQKSNS